MALILLYHRVTTLARDPQLLTVSPAHFAEHVKVLHRLAEPVPLSRLAADVRAGSVNDRAVALTFDDGYLDNLLEAAPILQSTGTPATVFSTLGRDEEKGEFFWDELDRIFLSPGRLPRRLHIADGPLAIDADLGESADYAAEISASHAEWDVTRADDPTPRHRVYRQACSQLRSLSVGDRESALSAIRRWAGVKAAVRSTHGMMNAAEVRELTREPLIEVGGHTVDHPRLSAENPAIQRAQIVANGRAIRSATGGAPRGFAYPFGTRRDYTAETAEIVKECGYEFASSNFAGRVTAGTDPYQLPRYIVRDWPGDAFERRLMTWLSS